MSHPTSVHSRFSKAQRGVRRRAGYKLLQVRITKEMKRELQLVCMELDISMAHYVEKILQFRLELERERKLKAELRKKEQAKSMEDTSGQLEE